MALSKSILDLDALADKLLTKSETLTPEEVSDEAPEKEEEVKKVIKETKPEKEEEEKEEKEEVETVEKSVETEPEIEPESEEEETEKESEEGSHEVEEEPAKPTVDEMEKSFHNSMIAEETIAKSLEASEFLQGIVSILSKSMADSTFETQMLVEDTRSNNEVLAKSLQASLTLNKSMHDQITAVSTQNAELKKSVEDLTGMITTVTTMMEEISHQPSNMRKSVSNIQTMERSFNTSLNGTDNAATNLSKGQIMDILSQEMYAGNQLVSPTDIISYESGAPLRPELANLVQSKAR